MMRWSEHNYRDGSVELKSTIDVPTWRDRVLKKNRLSTWMLEFVIKIVKGQPLELYVWKKSLSRVNEEVCSPWTAAVMKEMDPFHPKNPISIRAAKEEAKKIAKIMLLERLPK